MTTVNGSLILPRVNVEWGTLNLTNPTAKDSKLEGANLEGLGPLVYDVRVSMEDQGQNPVASMKWNPSGPAYAIYEKCIEKFVDYSIMVTFYYVTGKSITFQFYWAGQTEMYGKEMDITVKMASLLDGLVNANFFATVNADREEKGISFKDSVAKLEKQFGVKDYNLIRYTEQAKKDCTDAVVKAQYNDGSTFMDAVQSLVKDNGNNVFFNNIGTANAVVFTPYSYEGSLNPGSIVLYPPLNSQSPDPTKRYGYFIGPGIIQTFTRTTEWQPPQKSQEINAIMARKVEAEREKRKRESERRAGNPSTAQSASGQSATATSGVYGGKNSGNIRSSKNEVGPVKQDIFTKERTAKLSMSTVMCPSLTGIKPLDIIFIPSYSGSYLEDWIVSSVEYQQTKGGVDLSIQANRRYGSSDPMSFASSEQFTKNAEILGLIPKKDSSTLDNWIKYAWKDFLSLKYADGTTTTFAPSSPSPTSPSAAAAQLPVWKREGFSSPSAFIDQVSPILPLNESYRTEKLSNGTQITYFYDQVFYSYAFSAFSTFPEGSPIRRNFRFDEKNKSIYLLGDGNGYLPELHSQYVRYRADYLRSLNRDYGGRNQLEELARRVGEFRRK